LKNGKLRKSKEIQNHVKREEKMKNIKKFKDNQLKSGAVTFHWSGKIKNLNCKNHAVVV
jgi:hypothetical protein